MPELPEVETIRRDLTDVIVGKKIKTITVKLRRLVKSDYRMFIKTLTGATITAIERRGKLLMFSFKQTDYTLLVHLKMTGQLIFVQNKHLIAGGHSYVSMDFNLPNKYSYIIFEFTNGGKLFFNDMRTFGYMKLATPVEVEQVLAGYGIEPLKPEFTLKNFRAVLGKRKTSIKAALLNQSLFSGFGNIYADETCFAARVLPQRIVASLTDDEIKKLHRAGNAAMKQAIRARGTTFNTYVDASGRRGNFVRFLKVFGRAGKRCVRCKKGIIQKGKCAGRGTHWCGVCQR